MPSGVYIRTKEMKEVRKKKWQDPEYRERQIRSHTDKHHSKETIKKMSETHKKNWQNPEYREKQSKSQSRKGMSGKHHTKEAKIKLREANIDKKLSEETKQKMRKPKSEEQIRKQRERWQNPEYREKQLKAIFKGLEIKPNKPELLLDKLLQDLFPNEYRYVGDGSILIGYKNPDFININGQKKIIELFGDYWHKPEEEQTRIVHFSKHGGYQTLVVWEYELKDIKKLQEKLLSFHDKNLNRR